MPNIETTNIDTGSPVTEGKVWEDGLLTFAGADSFPAGTILARNTSTLKFIPYVKGGSSNGNGVPRAIMQYSVSKDGAGDLPVRVLTVGVVNPARLIIDADGDDSNIDGVVRDLLRQTGLACESVEQLARVDNPQVPGADS